MNHPLLSLLHEGGHSCVVRSGQQVRTFSQRGVADLYDLYTREPHFLRGADVADKVVGRGAAALMVLGGVRSLATDVLSTPARTLLLEAGIEVRADREVPHVINRAGTGQCPLEAATEGLTSAAEMWPIIRNFVEQMRSAAATRPAAEA